LGAPVCGVAGREATLLTTYKESRPIVMRQR